MALDVNADLAEGSSEGANQMALADFTELLGAVTSVNVACGFHGGDPSLMRAAVRAARSRNVAVGAHPSYPDKRGFGRVPMALPLETVVDDVTYQVGALAAIAHSEGVRLQHVRPHGALYNALSSDPVLAVAVAAALREQDPALRLVLRAGSPSLGALAASGYSALAEGFSDRAYLKVGTLAPRRRTGSVITDPSAVSAQALAIAEGAPVSTLDGGSIVLKIDTLHVNTSPPATLPAALVVKGSLQAAGTTVRAPGHA